MASTSDYGELANIIGQLVMAIDHSTETKESTNLNKAEIESKVDSEDSAVKDDKEYAKTAAGETAVTGKKKKKKKKATNEDADVDVEGDEDADEPKKFKAGISRPFANAGLNTVNKWIGASINAAVDFIGYDIKKEYEFEADRRKSLSNTAAGFGMEGIRLSQYQNNQIARLHNNLHSTAYTNRINMENSLQGGKTGIGGIMRDSAADFIKNLFGDKQVSSTDIRRHN